MSSLEYDNEFKRFEETLIPLETKEYKDFFPVNIGGKDYYRFIELGRIDPIIADGKEVPSITLDKSVEIPERLISVFKENFFDFYPMGLFNGMTSD